jgi:hypothetical protein
MNHQKVQDKNELALFFRKIVVRLFFLLLILMFVFILPIPKKYYYSYMERTIHSKLSWVWQKLNNTKSLNNTVVFVGSSVCFYGINDQLLSNTDTTGNAYLNLGVVHHCNDITDVVLQEMIVERNLKPLKVILCLKSDALARDVHHMYPLAATSAGIAQTLRSGNCQFLTTALKRAAWNMNYLTGQSKFNTGEDSLLFSGDFGYEPQIDADSAQMEKKYAAQHEGMESIFGFLESNAKYPTGIKKKLLSAKRNFIDNEYFQNRMFEKSALLLDEHQIDYAILLYPNLAASRAGKEEAMVEYAKVHLPGIDFKKHPILVIKDDKLSDAKSWVDMNHLSPEGAAIFSEKVRQALAHDH